MQAGVTRKQIDPARASGTLPPMLSVGTVVMGASDVRRAAVFWSRALGYVRRDGVVDDDWVVLLPAPGGHGTRLALGLSETPVQEHPRVHLDLYAGDADDQAAEVERLNLATARAADVRRDLCPLTVG